jgi:hypothetical protein
MAQTKVRETQRGTEKELPYYSQGVPPFFDFVLLSSTFAAVGRLGSWRMGELSLESRELMVVAPLFCHRIFKGQLQKSSNDISVCKTQHLLHQYIEELRGVESNSMSSASAVASSILFQKTLNDVVKGIRIYKNDPTEFISQCIADCKCELATTDPYMKSEAIRKLTYLQMVGYNIAWASFSIVEVMSQSRFDHKRIGYLAANQVSPSLLLDSSPTFLLTSRIPSPSSPRPPSPPLLSRSQSPLMSFS